MSNKKRLIDYFSAVSTNPLTSEEIHNIEEKWLSIFCNYTIKEKNEININLFKWHTFSNDKFPACQHNEAETIYIQQKSTRYFVLPEFHAHPNEVAFSTNMKPNLTLRKALVDFYVFPKNIAWTMAFTHEDGWFGPYFSKHPDFEQLNKKNIEAYNAQLRGWY
jgi:hypothetical protein